MLTSIRKAATAIVAVGALALGGAAIAGATDKTASPPSSSPGSGSSQTRPAPPQRDALSGDVAAKVKAAALDKVPGATVLRTEAGGPYGSPYHAHIRTSDGAQKVVLVDAAFKATAVEAEPGPQGPGRGGRAWQPRRPGSGRDRADRRHEGQGRSGGPRQVLRGDDPAHRDQRRLGRTVRVAHHDPRR